MKKIDISTWDRREHYEFFNLAAPCFNLSFPLDVTNLYAYAHEHKLSFYLILVYLSTEVMNEVENFRFKIIDDEVYLVDRLHPMFTHMKKGHSLFHVTAYKLDEPMDKFCVRAKELTENQTTFISNPDNLGHEEVIYFSSFPWVEMISLTNEHDADPNYSISRITWGKYINWGGRLKMNVSVEANHRLVDGYHIAQFAMKLQERIDKM